MKSKILLFLTLLFINVTYSQNLIGNPGFELGGSGIGFVANDTGYTGLIAPYSGTSVPGNFAVVNNPNTINTTDFIYEGDHTTGAGRMLVVDGTTTAGSRFWRAGNTGAGITTAVIGTTYRFSYWIKSISNLGSPANVTFQVVGGTAPVLTSGATIAPAPAQSWRHVIYTFVATATTVQLELINTNTSSTGNDFAIDDMMLTDDLMISVNLTDAACVTPNDGSVTVTGFGGTPPYTNYTLVGGAINLNNANGIFTNIPPGTYTVTITDSALPTPATVTMANIKVGPKITVPVNSPVCAGSTFQLNASGSPSNTYSWTSNPAGFTSNIANPIVTPTANSTIYTVTSTVGACAPITSSVTITRNPIPDVTSASLVQTICPGNTATFTIIGTANTTVTLEDPSVFPATSYTFNIGPAGIGTWTTPVLTESVVYRLVKIRGFFTLCERDLLPAAISLTVNVIPNGCATVQADPAAGTPPLDLTLCTAGECRTLEANVSPVPSTTTYTVSSIPYCPQAPFENPSWVQLYPLPASDPRFLGDDDWSDVFSFPAGMNFCFFGNNYNSLQVGTNGIITFKFHPPEVGGFPTCRWDYANPIPNLDYSNDGNLARDVSNSIMGVYQDTNFAVGDQAPNAKNINYQVVGTYPCRKFIVNYKDLPQFQCGNAIGVSTMQIVLYEVSNIVEVYVERRTACTGWNDGNGTIGIMNAAGTQGYAAPGRNAVPFSTDPTPNNPNNADNVPEAWRFTPTGPSVPQTITWYEGPVSAGVVVGTGPTVVVCPAVTTTYTLESTYQVCGVPQTATSTTTLNVKPDLTGAPGDLTECGTVFDLTVNTGVILGSLNPLEYDITYHINATDADSGSNPIPNPTSYSPGTLPGTYAVYASIYLINFNCHVVKPFLLIISNCSIRIGNLSDLTVCEEPTNPGTGVFDLTQQITPALDGQLAANYTITFHNTQPQATAGTPSIPGPLNTFNGVEGQIIYVRITDNSDNTIFATTSFTLHVSTLSNAGTDGSTTICETSTTPIDLFTLITGEQTGGVWTQTSGSGGVFDAANGTFTPSVGASTSTFTYTITGQAPCPNDDSLATVNIVAQPTAGADGGTVICVSSATPIDLFSLITGEQTGGTWTRTSGTGGVFNAGAGTFAPTATATTSTFDYTVLGVAPCSNDTSTATITISAQPDAGLDGSIIVCESSPTAIVLNTLISGEQAGGVWTQLSGTGGTFNAAAGTFTPAVGATDSSFEYTLSGTAPCITDTSLATVTIIALPNAGADGALTVCETSTTPINLFSLLTGAQTGGTWTRFSGTGGTFNAALGEYTPAPGATNSTFRYTVLGTAPCANDTSDVVITINTQPTAGADGNVTVCESSTAVINLSTLITGEQAGGVWTQTSGTGGTFNAAAGTFTPAIGGTTSTFEYTLTGVAPCIADVSIATVNVVALPNAGTDGALTVCETGTTPINLFSLLTGGQTGGTWTRISGTGGTFSAALGEYTPAPGATNSTFRYTVLGTAPCANDTSDVVITINPQPTAGADGNVTVCESSTAVINLSTLITGEQAGGVWTQTSGTGGTFNAAAGTFTPALGATTSTFEYTVTGVAPCIADVSIATITINPQPNAGNDGSLTVCETINAVIDLSTIISGQQLGGVWTRTSGLGGVFDATLGTFTPTIGATNSTFTYTLTGIAPCINDDSLASIIINAQPTAGADGAITICENSPATVNLNTLITGQQTGGVWTRTSGSGGTFNAAAGTFVSGVGATSSTFTYTVIGTAPCINDDSVATVNINPLPTATISGTTSVCMGASLPLITWTGANGTAPYTFNYTLNTVPFSITTASGDSVSLAIPSTATATTYIYTLVSVTDSSTTACSQNQTGTATVTVIGAPIISTPTDYVVCDDSLNNDGFYCSFDLTTKDLEVTSVGGITITYHETQPDADLGANPITTTSYCNIRPYTQPIFVRAFDPLAPTCYSTTSFNLIVNPIPIPNATIADYELCDYTGLPNQEVFDLSTMIPSITGLPGVTIRFYDNLPDAQNPTTSTPLSNLYANTANPQPIWFNISDNVTGCNTTGSFNLVVNPLPPANTPPTIFQCSNGVTPTAQFNLTINEAVVTGGTPGLTVTYYNNLIDAQNENIAGLITTPLTYTGTDNEIVHIRVEDAKGCYATTTQLLRVTQGPVANTPLPLQYCDPNNDGFGDFDLNTATASIAGSPVPSGVSVSYHETQIDAERGANPISLTTLYSNIRRDSQTLFVRVFYTLTGCANYTQLKLSVNPTPEAVDPADYELCDDNQLTPADIGFENFNLTTRIPEILGSISPTTVNVTFYNNLSDAQLGTGNITNVTSYPNGTINTETIYVRVEFIATGCFDIVPLTLVVNPLPNSLQPNYPQYSVCDNDQSLIGYEVFDLASRVNSILLGQPGMTVTFYESFPAAQNGTTVGQIFNLFYQNTVQYVQTLGVVITNQATGCRVVSSMDIRVEPLPSLVPPTTPYTICDQDQDGIATFNLNSLLPGLLGGVGTYIVTFHETQADADINGTSIPNPASYNNIVRYVQTIYVRAEDAITGCVSVIPLVLNVNPSPVAPVLLDDIVICDTDSNTQNAITTVDLTQRTADVLAQQPSSGSYTVTYYTSLANAQTGVGLSIVTPTTHTGSNGDTIWVRVEDALTQCFNIGSFQLEINIPLLLTTPTPLSICDDDANPNNQFTAFDLTVKDAEISQNLNTSGYTVTYYSSYALAQAGGASDIPDFTNYTNDSAHPAVQTLGVVVTSPDGCTSVTSLDIRVLPIPTPRTNPPALTPQCDYNSPGDMLEVFDLTVNEAYIANGVTNLTFHYFPTRLDAENNTNEIIPATTALVGSNVFIRVENTQVDYQGNRCYVIVEQALTVNPLPTVIQPLNPYRACDDDADGVTVFDLSNPLLAPQILGSATTGQLPSDYTISYYLTAVGANPATNTGETPLPASYTNTTPTTQTIYIRVVNDATTCVNATGTLDLVVEDYAVANAVTRYDACDNDSNPFDGVEVLNLEAQWNAEVLGTQDPAIFLVSYYTVDPTLNPSIGPLSSAEAQAYAVGPNTTIWIKVENSSNSITPFCSAVTQAIITIEPKPNPQIETTNGITSICVDFNTGQVVRSLLLDSGIANPSNYTFEWFVDGVSTGATGSTYLVDTASATPAVPRVYTVNVTSINPPFFGCDRLSDPFPVQQSGQAVVPTGTTGFVVTNAFSDSQSIVVNIQGYSTNYQYSLDDGPRQISNVFENVSFEPHIIHVWDMTDGVAYSCDELEIRFAQTIDYPHYFTPNGDGFNDTWFIRGLQDQPGATIYIFDRYGKLLKQISAAGIGWDGTYNGHLLPSDDYWFTVDYIEPGTSAPRQFKAHFTLKR